MRREEVRIGVTYDWKQGPIFFDQVKPTTEPEEVMKARYGRKPKTGLVGIREKIDGTKVRQWVEPADLRGWDSTDDRRWAMTKAEYAERESLIKEERGRWAAVGINNVEVIIDSKFMGYDKPKEHSVAGVRLTQEQANVVVNELGNLDKMLDGGR